MTSQVKESVLISLLNIAAVVPKVSSPLKTTIHLISHKQNPQTEIYQLAVTGKIISQPSIQFCGICSWSIMANRLPWSAWKTSLSCSTFMSHLNKDHMRDCSEKRNIFQLHYGTVNKSPSQQIGKCLATVGIALCLHAVQCGCQIILREWKCFWWLTYTYLLHGEESFLRS